MYVFIKFVSISNQIYLEEETPHMLMKNTENEKEKLGIRKFLYHLAEIAYFNGSEIL